MVFAFGVRWVGTYCFSLCWKSWLEKREGDMKRNNSVSFRIDVFFCSVNVRFSLTQKASGNFAIYF